MNKPTTLRDEWKDWAFNNKTHLGRGCDRNKIADWWLSKFSSHNTELLSKIEGKIKVLKEVREKRQKEFNEVHDQWFKYGNRSKEVEEKLKFFEGGLMQGNAGEIDGNISALDEVISLIKEKNKSGTDGSISGYGCRGGDGSKV